MYLPDSRRLRGDGIGLGHCRENFDDLVLGKICFPLFLTRNQHNIERCDEVWFCC